MKTSFLLFIYLFVARIICSVIVFVETANSYTFPKVSNVRFFQPFLFSVFTFFSLFFLLSFFPFLFLCPYPCLCLCVCSSFLRSFFHWLFLLFLDLNPSVSSIKGYWPLNTYHGQKTFNFGGPRKKRPNLQYFEMLSTELNVMENGRKSYLCEKSQ